MTINYTRATGLFTGSFTKWYKDDEYMPLQLMDKKSNEKVNYAGVMLLRDIHSFNDEVPIVSGYGNYKFSAKRDDNTIWIGSWIMKILSRMK